jgi:tetratricopeptide (TPR) repeat protein
MSIGSIIVIIVILRVIFNKNSSKSKYVKLYEEYGYKELKYRKMKKIFIYEDKNQYGNAIQELDKIIQDGTNEMNLCYKHKGRILIQMEDFFGASASYEKALAISPNDKELIKNIDRVNYNITNKLINEGKAQEAINFLLNVLHQDEGRSTVSNLNNLSWAYNTIRDYDRALEYSDYGLEKDAKDYYLLTNKGNAFFGLGRNEEALVEYDKVISLASDYPFAWYGKGISKYYLKNYEEAEKAFRRYLEIKKDPDEDAYYYISECLHKQRKFKEEIEFFDALIAKNNKEPWYYNSKANTLCCLNKFHKSIECFDKVIELNANYATAYYSKCRIFCKFNILDGALDMLKKAVEIDKKYIDIAKGDEGLESIRRFKQYEDIIA